MFMMTIMLINIGVSFGVEKRKMTKMFKGQKVKSDGIL